MKNSRRPAKPAKESQLQNPVAADAAAEFASILMGGLGDIRTPSPAMKELIKKVNAATTVSNKDRKLARAFLACAFLDLKACVLLRQRELYPLAVYHLQQAAEKTVKAWAIDSGVLSARKVQETLHRTPMVFLNMMAGGRLAPLVDYIKKQTVHMPTDVNGARKIISSGSHPGTARMPEGQIRHLTTLLNNLADASMLLGSLAELSLSEANAKWKRSPGLSIGEGLVVFLSLYILGMITFPHEAFTRYPAGDSAAGKLSPEDYDTNLGIVICMPDLEKRLRSTMNLLRKGFNRYDRAAAGRKVK
jgi:hypothetical protein